MKCGNRLNTLKHYFYESKSIFFHPCHFESWLIRIICCSVVKSCWTLCNPWTIACCPPLSPEVCSNSCPLSQWCYLTVLSCATPFFFCLQSFPTLGSFQMSWLFTSGGQSIGTSALASVLPMNIQGWLPLRLNGLISLMSKEISRVFSSSPPKPPNACQLGKSMGIKKRLRKISWLDYRKEPKIS